ncbi:polysaccharide lyase family 8 super-sandwich domain protein [Sesbania bispinosa]|nr:polysaccharide lyase family 8 super-sandwich domain protein [Sesbania bispinosa]
MQLEVKNQSTTHVVLELDDQTRGKEVHDHLPMQEDLPDIFLHDNERAFGFKKFDPNAPTVEYVCGEDEDPDGSKAMDLEEDEQASRQP